VTHGDLLGGDARCLVSVAEVIVKPGAQAGNTVSTRCAPIPPRARPGGKALQSANPAGRPGGDGHRHAAKVNGAEAQNPVKTVWRHRGTAYHDGRGECQ
jgi:hypothetical protein